SLAQEFGLKADVKVLSFALPGLLFEGGAQHILHRAGHERGTEHEYMATLLFAHGTPQFARDLQVRGEILAAIRRGRRADAYKRELRVPHGPTRVAGDGDMLAPPHARHELHHAFFDHGCAPVADEVELCAIDIDPHARMSVPREAGQGHRPDV